MTDVSRQNPRRMAVVGGGITGLAAAHRLIELSRTAVRPVDVTLFEASDRVGGVAGTIRIGEYLVETGADNFITNKPAAVRLCERLGLRDRLLPTETKFRGSLVLRNGKPLPVPEGFMLLTPAKIWPVLASRIFTPWGKLRMGLEYFIPRRGGDEDESLADFVRRRFGCEALERLVQPLVGGIYTSDPERLSLKATLPRFLEMERRYRSLIRASRRQLAGGDRSSGEYSGSGARYGLFATLKDGMSELFDALAQAVRCAGNVRIQTRVERLERLPSNRTRLAFDNGDTSDFDRVILALPAYRAAELLRSLEGASIGSESESAAWLHDLCSELDSIEYASTAIVVSGHQLANIEHPLDAFGLVIPAIEKRRVLAVSFSSRKFPGRAPAGRVILRTFVGGAMQPEQLTHSDDRLCEIVSDELRDLLGVRGQPDFMRVVRHERSMPQYYVGHLDRVQRIEEHMRRLPGIVLAGNAFRGVGLPDCIESAENAAEAVLT